MNFSSRSDRFLRFLAFLASTCLALPPRPSSAADWPCWRGTDGLGVSSERNLPSSWSKTEHVAWKVAIPGRGASSPIAVGDRIYMTTQTADSGLHVLAFDRRSGQRLWD